MSTHETIIGEYAKQIWRQREDEGGSPYVIGVLKDERKVKGPISDSETLFPGITYEFYGKWSEEHPKYGSSFVFSAFVMKVPHSRDGIVTYLEKNCKGIGPVIAGRIYDAFGAESVKVLRTDPARVANTSSLMKMRLSLEMAIEASQALQLIADLEDTKIGLTDLFAGRGFPGALMDECVRKWKIKAPEFIKRDPFVLLVNGMSGCGFARCDRLYTDLLLPPHKLKRQMICLWHALHADSSGNTWITADAAVEKLKQTISGTKLQPKKAIKLGLRSGWLEKYKDDKGVMWLAEGERGRNEAFVAEQLKLLGSWGVADTTQLRTLVAMSEVSESPVENELAASNF